MTARVLMPRHAMGPTALSELGRRLGAHVLDGVAGDLGADQRLDQIQQVPVGEEREHRRGPHLHDVHAIADLACLLEQQAVPGIERRAFAAVGERARIVQLARPPVDERLQLVDHRLRVGVGQDAGHEQIPHLLERAHLFSGKACHVAQYCHMSSGTTNLIRDRWSHRGSVRNISV